jgi:hypothetical protein
MHLLESSLSLMDDSGPMLARLKQGSFPSIPAVVRLDFLSLVP